MAMCFGWPSSIMWNSNPKWASPLVPGWNCIVAAAPLSSCKSDGSQWNVGNLGASPISNSNSSQNSFVNSNSCRQDPVIEPISAETNENIAKYIRWDSSYAKTILNNTSVQNWWLNLEAWPLISIWWGGDSSWMNSLDVSIDSKALTNFDFWNIVKVNFKRVVSFPDFIMDWVTRQIEEIVTKLTTLPTLYIILPDFSAVNSKAKDLWEKVMWTWWVVDKVKSSSLSSLKTQIWSSYDSTKSDLIDFWSWFVNNSNKKASTSVASKNIAWIQIAYQFLSSIPLVQLDSKVVNLNIPWISPNDLNKWVAVHTWTLAQWKTEYQATKASWTWALSAENIKVLADADKLINGLEENIKILNEYKNFPDKLVKFLKFKEKYTSQILCNVGVIEDMMWGYIAKNWKIFKSWVELIVLIKAILKSWQGMIDLFYDYKVWCESCKNERYDLLYFIIKLISALIPQIPVIQFPKWPDIILDLHSIKAWITIVMPDFKLNPKPIVLPNLPELNLPDAPSLNVKVTLPTVPVLPSMPELPELPDIPSLPQIKLPDLPPPPTVPKIFSSIEWVVNILKLVSKVLCIYKNFWKFFTPEWKAWDSIAFMTERSWNLPIDNLFVDMPQFSYSFVDAIKVSSFVNFEFEVDFIYELAKTVSNNFNRYSTNVSNTAKSLQPPEISFPDPDIPNININATNNWVNLQWYTWNDFRKLVYVTMADILKLVNYIDNNKDEKVTVKDFKNYLTENTKSLAISENPKERQIYSNINAAVNYNFEKEDKLIKKLWETNKEKFSIIKEYLNNEKTSNAKLISELEWLIKRDKSIENFSPLLRFNNSNLKVAATSDSNLLSYYKDKLDNFNNRLVNDLGNAQSTVNSSNIKEDWDALIKDVQEWTNEFKKDYNENLNLYKNDYEKFQKKFLALETTNIPSNASSTSETGGNSWLYSYDYKWIYVINSNWKQSRLFNYIDEIDWNEEIVELDRDGDNDFDIVYRMRDWIYVKDSLKNQKQINNANSVEVVSNIDGYLKIENQENIFAPNYFKPKFGSLDSIEFSFNPGDIERNNRFRLEYYDYIDRFDKTNNKPISNESIFPKAKLNYVDLVNDPGYTDEYINWTWELYISRKTPAFINYWEWEWSVLMKDYKILQSWESLIVQKWKIIYTDNSDARIKYKGKNDDSYKILTINENSNVEFKENSSVSVIDWNIILFYDNTSSKTIDLADIKWFPVFPWEKIDLNNASKLQLWYSDWNTLDLNDGNSYYYYDLWQKDDSYKVSLSERNWFYYWKMYSEWVSWRSNITDLSLFAPQLESDNESPLLSLDSTLKIPVYQKQTIDLKKYLSDLSWINEVYVDWNLSVDSDWDWINNNDKDSLNPNNSYWIKKWSNIYLLEFWPFDNLLTRKIRLHAKDNNANLIFKDINLEVYAPLPQISSNTWSVIKWKISDQIKNEPIDIFRFRNWILERINIWSGSFTDESWKFTLTWSDSKWIEIRNSSWTVITSINEKTWKIELKESGYSIKVTQSSEYNPTSIHIIRNIDSKEVFKQSMNSVSNTILQRVVDFNDLTNNWIFIKLSDEFDFSKNSNMPSNLKNWWYIVDSEKNPILGVSLSWNIYLLNNGYDLKYSNFNDYVVINLMKWWATIWEILYKIDSEFILR